MGEIGMGAFDECSLLHEFLIPHTVVTDPQDLTCMRPSMVLVEVVEVETNYNYSIKT